MPKGDKLNQFLISSFDESYFYRYGVSWIASLKEISNFKGVVVLIAFDFKNQKIIDVLKSNDLLVIQKDNVVEKREEVFDIISDLQEHSEGMYAYFDIDGYFDDNIQDLYDIDASDYLLVAGDSNMGFCAGKNDAWKFYKDYRKFENFLNFNRSLADFVEYNKHIVQIDYVWNCTEPNRIPIETKAKFVHYSYSIKQTADDIAEIEFSFQKKYPEHFNKWQNIFFGQAKPLLKNFLVRKKSNEPLFDMGK